MPLVVQGFQQGSYGIIILIAVGEARNCHYCHFIMHYNDVTLSSHLVLSKVMMWSKLLTFSMKLMSVTL